MSLGDHATLTITFPELRTITVYILQLQLHMDAAVLEHSFLWIRVKKGIRPPLLCLLVVILAR